MQSKTLLRLHHMTFDVFKNTKLIFDLLYLCSAEVAQFPFEDDQRNQDREKLFEDLVVRDCSLPKTDITLGRDLERWKTSREKRQRARKTIGPKPQSLTLSKERLYRESCASILQKLIQNIPEMKGEFGEALWYSIYYREMSLYDLQYLYNKLISIWDQFKLLHGKRITVIDQDFSWETST